MYGNLNALGIVIPYIIRYALRYSNNNTLAIVI